MNCQKDCQSEVVDFYVMGHRSRVRKLDSQEYLTAGQIILFNTKKAPEKVQQKLRHSLDPPLPSTVSGFKCTSLIRRKN